MKLVGFGCSITFGSELYHPDVNIDDFHGNTKYREAHSWLGQLGSRFNCSSTDNLSQPANSNFAIGQQVANYFLTTTYDPEVVICIGWTHQARMSWLSGKKWVHNGFIDKIFSQSHKEWVANTNENDHLILSNNAKFAVNSMCASRGTRLIQFSACGSAAYNPYNLYYLNGTTMQEYLSKRGKELGRNYFADGGHPNELGHAEFTEIMAEWVQAKKLL
jgi:hypothetical protein